MPPFVYIDSSAERLLKASPSRRRALFLDRDGVINIDHGYVHRPENTEWVAGVFDLAAEAKNAGFLLVVVTNQAGIARGYYSESDFLDYTRWMHGEFEKREVPLLATYYCPHHPNAGVGPLLTNCNCRKPAPGMIIEAHKAYSIDLKGSVLIGNSDSDIQAGWAAGIEKLIMLGSSNTVGEAIGATMRARSMTEVKEFLRDCIDDTDTWGAQDVNR